MSDALGQDQFQPVNRRAGYGDALEMALSAARKGWTLSAGQGALIVEHYEEKLAAARAVTDAQRDRAWKAFVLSLCVEDSDMYNEAVESCMVELDDPHIEESSIFAALTAALTQEAT